MKSLLKLSLAACILALAAVALAHGVSLDSSRDPATGEITVRAAFDTGEVLDGAQVAIFAPSDLVNPWLTGTTDSEGAFTFLPDYTLEGVWDVQVRRAGHGGLLSLQLDAGMMPPATGSGAPAADGAPALALEGGAQVIITGDARFEVRGDIVISGGTPRAGGADDAGGSGFTPAQIIIMAASVVWGFIGTALYFAQRQKRKG